MFHDPFTASTERLRTMFRHAIVNICCMPGRDIKDNHVEARCHNRCA